MSTQELPAQSAPPRAIEQAARPQAPAITLPILAQPWARRDTLIMLLAIALALTIYLVRLHAPTRYIYDEVYHAYTAALLAEGNRDPYMFNTKVPPEDKERFKVHYEWSHPALAKPLMQLGILVFGDNSFGWRFMSAIFGSLGIGLMFALGRVLFDRFVAIAGAGLLLLDGLWFVQSRTAMNDVFLVCFLMLAYLCFALYLGRAARRGRWLALTALALGLAVAVKWSALYSIGLLGTIATMREIWLAARGDRRTLLWALPTVGLTYAVIVASAVVALRAWGFPTEWPVLIGLLAAGIVATAAGWRWLPRPAATTQPRLEVDNAFEPFAATVISKRERPSGPLRFVAIGATLVGTFAIVPFALYLAGYAQFFAMGWTLPNWRDLQEQMWWYHSNLRACHDWASPWWSWPLMIKPVWYHVTNLDDGRVAQTFTMGNPAIWWVWLPALGFVAHQWRRSRFATIGLGLVLLGYFGQMLPWVLSPRISYLYHMLPSVPFGVLAVAYTLGYLRQRRRLVWSYAAVVLLVFAFFYSHYSALVVPRWYNDAHYWLPTWIPGSAWGFKCPLGVEPSPSP